MTWKRGTRLKLLAETGAPARTRAIFDEVRHCLGIPRVPLLYQAYAAFPIFLETHWLSFKPLLETRQFFQMGARLAAESYTRAHNYFTVAGVARIPEAPATGLSVSQVLDYYQYLDPLLLLIAVTQMQGFEGPVGDEDLTADPALHPDFPVAPFLASESESDGATQQIWGERRKILDFGFISEEHRALALWPRFYRDFWSGLKDLLRSPLYTDCQYRIGESAWAMAKDLPVTIETSLAQLADAGLSGEELSSLSRMNESLATGMTGLLLDITFARIACEGGSPQNSLTHNSSVDPRYASAGSPIRAA